MYFAENKKLEVKCIDSVWRPPVKLQNYNIAMEIYICYSSITDLFARAEYVREAHTPVSDKSSMKRKGVQMRQQKTGLFLQVLFTAALRIY